jgi:putative DNA primase/helicase
MTAASHTASVLQDASAPNTAPNDAPDSINAEIARLAKLPLVQYERERKAAAEKLEMRIGMLDFVVAAQRGNAGDAGKQGRPLEFPEAEPWPTAVNGIVLLNELITVIRRYVVMPDHAIDAVALWIIHTYLIDFFEITPRLAITSPEKRCGKTTLRDVLSRLVYRPLPTENATGSAIFRIIESARPTLLIDEADTFFGDKDELRGILNSGHRRGGSVIRTVGDDFEPRVFSTHAAVAIAMIGKLAGTLADRSIQIAMRRRRRTDANVEPFRSDRVGYLGEVVRRATRWAIDNGRRFVHADPPMPEGVINRAADNWRPLLAIADAVGFEWPTRARNACVVLTAERRGDDSVGAILLADIRDIFSRRGVDKLPSLAVVSELVAIEGRPWAEWGKIGQPLTQNGLARILDQYEIEPIGLRIGVKTPRGYELQQFQDAFTTYLPPEGGIPTATPQH